MKTILHNWHFMRLLRVILAVAILIQSWYAKDSTAAVIGLLLLVMAFLNVGCCGSNDCYVVPKKKKNVSVNDSVYEEVV